MTDTTGVKSPDRQRARRPAVGLPRLLDIRTLADHLGVTQRFIRRLVAENRIPYMKVGRFVRFDAVEIAAWIDQTGVRQPGYRPS